MIPIGSSIIVPRLAGTAAARRVGPLSIDETAGRPYAESVYGRE